MFGIGAYQQGLLYQDGIYGGLMVASSSGLNVRVGTGLAIVGRSILEQTATGAATDILLPAGATSVLYVNAPNALDANGSTLSAFGITPEAPQSHTNINGTVGTINGRSLPLCAVTVSAHSGTVTLTGTWSAADTITVTIDGTAVVTTLTTPQAASVTAAAAAVRDAINANATVAAKVVATAALGVVTVTALTSGTASAYTLVAADTGASGTATASGGNLAGAAITKVDNTFRLKPTNIPATTLTSNIGPFGLISY